MRALVTGASGFLGSHLCRRLLAEQAEVHATSRADRSEDPDDRRRWWRCDPADAGAIGELVARVKPDVVFHLAGAVTAAPDLELVAPTFHGLLESTVNVLTAATAVGGCRVVLPASLEEPSHGTADTLVPLSPYAAAKFAAGAYARMFGALYRTPVVSLRIFMAYGPGQHPAKVVPNAILALLRGEAPRLSSGSRRLDWVYVDDAIDALVAAADRPGLDGRTLDVGSGTGVAIRDVIGRIVRLLGPSIRPAYGARPDRPEGSEQVANVEPAARMLGWRATTALDDGLARTVEWYRHLPDS